MNRIVKYVVAVILICVLAFGGWVVITTTLPMEEWSRQYSEGKGIINLLLVIGAIGVLVSIVELKKH